MRATNSLAVHPYGRLPELLSARPGELSGTVLGDAEVTSLVGDATAHRVLGPALLAAIESGIDAPGLTDALVERLRSAMAWCLELELRLLEIRQWFDDAGGVEFVVLKGPAVAHLDEADPTLRSFADLDLLIHRRDMDRAIAALDAHGAVRRIPERRPGFDRRFIKGVGTTCVDGIEIDVHRTLCVGALAFRIPLDDLFAHADHINIGGELFATLALPHRALHAAYHAVVGSSPPALHTLRDIAGYLTRKDLDVRQVIAEARRWRGETVLHRAVGATLHTLRVDSPAWTEWHSGFTPDPRDVRIIEASQTRARWPIERAVLRELGWRDRVALVWAVATPSPEVLADRHQSRGDRLAKGVRTLIRRGR